MRRLARFLLWAALGLSGLVVALCTAYFIRGSLESFPTEEQTAKVRAVTGAMILALLALAAVIVWVLRRLPPN